MTVNIHSTSDYSIFSFIKGNRSVSKKRVTQIVNEVKGGLNLLPYYPIIVTKDFKIIDGQRRFKASVILEHPIYYVVADNLGIEEAAILNNETWRNDDYFNRYIKAGNKDYGILKKKMKVHRVSLTVAASLLKFNEIRTRAAVLDDFKSGNFQVNYEKETDDFLLVVEHLFGMFGFNRDVNFLQAIHQIYKKNIWDIDRMRTKIKNNKALVGKQSSERSYVFLIEHIYNINERTKLQIS